MKNIEEKTIIPPPWKLHGEAYILLYRFPENFVQSHAFLQSFQQGNFKGVVGTVMLVNYHESGVGPYQELLFIPGLFKLGGKTTFSISKIFVSSQASVDSGIENWGIPKELAEFDWQPQRVQVRQNGQLFFDAQFRKSWGYLPITTALFPLNVTQLLREELILTQPSASGMGRLSGLESIAVDAQFFPDLSQVKPLLTLHIPRFQMTFPIPQKTPFSSI
jgi:Acetoacetate decarboxylase (ADC)